LIGILGGTFDPVHFGHLRPALEVMQGVGLDELRFIPLYRPVHREPPLASVELRLRMLRAAIQGQPGFVLDERELARRGDSYTVDTLHSLRAELGSERPLCLLVGGDGFSQFLSWRQPMEILALAHLIVMRRPGHGRLEDPRLRRLLERRQVDGPGPLRRRPAGSIHFQPVTQLEISSTQIRQLLGAGLSPRYLLPGAVLGIIRAENLYST